MDLTSEDPMSDPEVSLEEDIVDQICTVDIDDEIPARPGSRLGFNCFEDDDTPLDDEPLDGVREDRPFGISTPLIAPSERLVDDEFDITERDTTYKTSTTAGSCGVKDTWGSLHEPQDISDDDDSESSYSSCDEESDTSSDFAVDPFSEPLEDADWNISPKFSCLPSPLSSRYGLQNRASYRHTPPRHRYRQHGHSRHALLHLKWFWAAREEMWIEHKAQMCEAKAYDGLSIFRSVSPGLRLPGGYVSPDPADTPHPPPPPMTQLPPLSIHPRRGDLSALHDPYCMHIDRYFVGMPLWTMAKTLWMFDVHMAIGDLQARSESPRQQEELESDLFEESPSESESINTLDSNAFSDDSDTTLVDSENELDLTGARPVTADQDAKKDVGAAERDPDIPSSSSSSSTSTSKTRCSPIPSFSWVTNWYRRWEILLQLCVENNSKMADHSPPAVSPPPSKKPRFFIDDDDWTDVLDDDDDEREDDEPEKNVLVVVNSARPSDSSLRHWS